MPERTEAPTGRRLAEARDKGQVPLSRELTAASVLLTGTLVLRSAGARLANSFQVTLVRGLTSVGPAEIDAAWLRGLITESLSPILPDLGLLLAALLLTGAGITFAQTGFLWSSHNISPDLNRLNPIPGLKRIFSPNGLMELGKMLLKLLVIGWVVYSFLRSHLQELLLMAGSDLSHSMAVWVGLASGLALQVSGVYLVLALADFVYQRWFFRRSLRMTRDEVKEEMKRTEGDPVLKGRIRQQQRRLARQRMMANVRKADVVITNPTHLAVAVQYEANRMHAPRVLAKGAYRVAARIVELARIHRVPVVQNPPLARAIYRSVDVEQEIPPDLYLVMAEVLAYVYRLRAPGRSGANPGLRALPHAAGLAAAPDTTG